MCVAQAEVLPGLAVRRVDFGPAARFDAEPPLGRCDAAVAAQHGPQERVRGDKADAVRIEPEAVRARAFGIIEQSI
jgi:hypothetical protein